MELSEIFMLPGWEIWRFLVEKIFTSLIYTDLDFQRACAFFITLFFWAWVYRIVAILLCKAFGLEGRRHGA